MDYHKTPVIIFCKRAILASQGFVMAEPRLLQGLKVSVAVGQRLIPGLNGSILAGGQIGKCFGKLCNIPKDCCRVVRDAYRSS